MMAAGRSDAPYFLGAAMSEAFDFGKLFVKGLPAPAAAFGGFAKYNFIGGGLKTKELQAPSRGGLNDRRAQQS